MKRTLLLSVLAAALLQLPSFAGTPVRKTVAEFLAMSDTDTTYGAAAADTPGLVKQAAAVADATSETVMTQLNALLAALRTAGIIAAE